MDRRNGLPCAYVYLGEKKIFLFPNVARDGVERAFVFEIKNFETSTLFVSDRLQLGVHYLQLSSKQSNNIPRSSSFSLVFVVSLV